MCTPPPEFLPVLLGHESFLRDGDGNVRVDENGNPLYVVPTADVFLEMKPSKEAQQFWPAHGTQAIPKGTSVVLFSIAVNTDCQDKNVITEVGCSIYDTASIYDGHIAQPYHFSYRKSMFIERGDISGYLEGAFTTAASVGLTGPLGEDAAGPSY
ncbi:hypothetical protein F4802DRAFT_598519 [Xylaria palmicola]|nr:hypothetical protein F4802DRAFT_598519 [Xylaria palmicola]